MSNILLSSHNIFALVVEVSDGGGSKIVACHLNFAILKCPSQPHRVIVSFIGFIGNGKHHIIICGTLGLAELFYGIKALLIDMDLSGTCLLCFGYEHIVSFIILFELENITKSGANNVL